MTPDPLRELAARATRYVTVDDGGHPYANATAKEVRSPEWQWLSDNAPSLAVAAADLAEALRRLAEGNLGDDPWQANYQRIQEVAREALAAYDKLAERAK